MANRFLKSDLISSQSSLLAERKKRRAILIAFPVVTWLFVFLCLPLFLLAVYSLQKRGAYGGVVWVWDFRNYERLFDWIYIRIFWNSFKLALFTTVSCLIIGYPFAFLCACVNKRLQYLLLILIMIPFLTNFVIRAYAFKLLLGIEGPVVAFLLAAGWLEEAVPLSNQVWAVWFGMISNYLPFMVLPLFVAMDRFDFTLLHASWDLGANWFRSLWKVLLPSTIGGIRAGCLLVFIPAMGEFVIPDLLGGARVMLVGNLITEQFLKARDWPFGSSLSLVLILAALLISSLKLFTKQKEKSEKKIPLKARI